MNNNESHHICPPSRARIMLVKALIWLVRVICAAAVVVALTNRQLRDITGAVLPIILFIGVMVCSQWLNAWFDNWITDCKPPASS